MRKLFLGAVLAAGLLLPAAPAQADTGYEDRLNSSVQRLLDAVIGPGHAVATTHVELDLDQVSTVTRSYTRDPALGALSENVSRTSYIGADGSRYESTGAVRTNALNEVYETRTKAPGEVKKLSVAVVVDRPVDVAQLRRLVTTAVGADQVVISVAQPRTESAVVAAPTASVVSGRTVFIGLALLAVLAGILLALRRRRPHPAPAPVRAYQVEPFHTPAAITAAPRPALDDPRRTAALLREWTETR